VTSGAAVIEDRLDVSAEADAALVMMLVLIFSVSHSPIALAQSRCSWKFGLV
jgi:hypothetical protein